MAVFIKKNYLKILLSLIGGAAGSFILAVNIPGFWTLGRMSKVLAVSFGALCLSMGLFWLISLALFFQKKNSKKSRNIHISIASVISAVALIFIIANYSPSVPPKWIFSAGREIEIVALIVSGVIILPLISYDLLNCAQRYLWGSLQKSLHPVILRNYQAVFIGFAIIMLIGLGILFRSPTIVTDDFSMNNLMMRIYSGTKYLLGDKLFPYTIRGEGNWLAFADSESIPDYQNAWSFTADELNLIERNVTHLYKYLDNKGIELYFIFPPNKNTIYPEIMPKEIPVLGKDSRMDQVVELFKDHPEVNFIDLETIFTEEKKTKQIYYATDSHWNNEGSYIAYYALTDLINEDFPTVQPHPFDYYQLAPPVFRPGDVANLAMLNISEEFSQSVPKDLSNLVSSQNENIRRYLKIGSTNPRLLMFHDSFGDNLLLFMLDNFSYSTYVHSWIIDPLIIEAERPDIVIIEITERKLFYLMQIPDLWED